MNRYFLKRPFDFLFSAAVLIVFSPLFLGSMLAVWLQDFKNAFYMAKRVALGGADFTMIKIRSMVLNAEKSGVNSTGSGDMRITKVGHFIRRYKVDELSQFINVLIGNMSVVGPRPNTRAWGVDLYTDEEQGLLTVRPGITDLSSIVFSDEGEILKDEPHADEAYNALIRPWKSRLGLLYIANQSLILDIRIIWLTALAVINKRKAIEGVGRVLADLDAPADLRAVCQRDQKLVPATPPGA
jgi:lipopolysaccharide/colanic/teichoic acid biosynthesis glycosyltransferase